MKEILNKKKVKVSLCYSECGQEIKIKKGDFKHKLFMEAEIDKSVFREILSCSNERKMELLLGIVDEELKQILHDTGNKTNNILNVMYAENLGIYNVGENE